MIKEKIIQTASALYARYGIKSVSMDDLAKELGISKKTLYVEFENKEELLKECFKYEMERSLKSVEETENNSESSLEVIMCISSDIFRGFASLCPAFYKDLKRFPQAGDVISNLRASFREKCIHHFNKGVEEGSFLPGQNYEFIASIFVEQIGNMKFEYQSSVIFTFIRGICTPQGIEELKRLSVTGGFTDSRYK